MTRKVVKMAARPSLEYLERKPMSGARLMGRRTRAVRAVLRVGPKERFGSEARKPAAAT